METGQVGQTVMVPLSSERKLLYLRFVYNWTLDTILLVINIDILQAVKNNGSLYLHSYFVRSGKSPNPDDKDNYDRKATVYRSKRMYR